MIAYKFLSAGGVGRFSDFHWPLPHESEPGEWVSAVGSLDNCLNGIHACRSGQLLDWIDEELWEIELDGDVLESSSMLVAERGRLLRRMDGWDSAAARDLGTACAWQSRALAVGALEQIGLHDEARQFGEAGTLEEVQALAVAVVEAHGESIATEVAAFTADTVSLVGGQRPEAWRPGSVVSPSIAQSSGATAANVAFVVAHTSGRVAAEAQDGGYDSGFAAERTRQLAWLAGRIGL